MTTSRGAGADASDRVSSDVPSGATWWVCAASGALLMAYGAFGLLQHLEPPALARWLLWFAGSLLVHDFVVAPLYVAGGGLVSRALPPRARAPLQAAALVTGALLFATVPTVLRLGRDAQPGNDSVLPFAYGPRLAAVLGAVWAVAAAVAVARSRRAARRRPSVSAPPAGARRGAPARR